MNLHHHSCRWALLALALFPFASAAVAADPPAPDDVITIQTRGPVHEAYARPSRLNADPAPVVPKEPPKPVPETPPDQKPEGDNVQWLPGYWGWDTDKNDFIWVSGCWRVAPPGRKWVPGHWAKVEGGWQWVSGLWAPEQEDELRYLPAPPRSLDIGPSAPSPDDNSLYVPGNWVFRDDEQYWWRPGYWCAGNSDWIWTPSCYCWTPSGYLYCSGYWDHCFPNRGLLFAPVCFNRPLWNTPGWCFTPRYAVKPGSLLSCLFAGPRHCYYFGNYYAPQYAGLGFRPWYGNGSPFHNALFSHSQWANRGNANWLQDLRADHLARLNGHAPLPPLTLAAQGNMTGNGNKLQTVTPLSQLRDGAVRLTRVQPSEHHSLTTSVEHLQQFGAERNRLEQTPAAGSSRPSLSLRQGEGTAAAGSSGTDALPRIINGSPSRQSQELSRVPGVSAPLGTPSTSAYRSPNADATIPMPRILNGTMPAESRPSFPSTAGPRPSILPYTSPRGTPSYTPPTHSPTYVRPAASYSPPAHSSPPPHSSAPSHGGGHSGGGHR